MGAYLSEPMTAKESEDGEGNRLKFGACSMQGWRVSQEDAHNCIAAFDEDSSLFAVYDGHGGAEVAIFLSRRLPDVLKCCTAYKNGEFVKGLKECYLKIDESIKTPEVLKEIQQIAKRNAADNEAVVDYEEENVGALYEEATMPLDKLVAKYQAEANEVDEEEPNCKPGSSKSITGCSSSSPGSSKSSSTSGAASSAGRSSDTPAGGSSSSSTKRVEADAPGGGSSSSGTGAGSSSSAKSSSEGKVDSSSPAKCSPDSALGSSTSKVNGEGPAEEPKSLSEENEKEAKTEMKEKNSDNDKESATTHSLGELIVEGKRIELKREDMVGDTNGSSKNEPSELNPLPGVNGNSSSSPEKLKEVELAKPEGEKMELESTKEENTGTITNGEPSSIAEQDKCKATTEKSPPAETPRRKKVHPTPVIIENSTPERRSPRKSQNSNLRSFDCSDSDESDEDDEDAGYDMEDSDSDEEMLEEEEDDEEEESSDDYDDEDAEEDEKFLNDIQEPGYDSGSTAVVCYMKWEADSLSLWVANAGDSRCVVCREGKAIDMSHDHKPELDEEAQRIVKAGGKVTDDGRVNGGLNLSRAIGDHSYKQNATLPPEEQMISPMPCVEHIVLHPSKDKFIVLACDGIWNSMGSQEVVDFVGGRLDKNEPLSKICEELFDTCLATDTGGDGTGCDNMTAIIVQLSDSPQAFSGSKRRHGSGETKPDPETLKKSRAD